MFKWLQIVVVIVAFVLAGALGRALMKSHTASSQRPVASSTEKNTSPNKQDTIAQELQLMADELNSACPQPAGPGITLTSCSAGPGVRFTYSYSVDQATLATLDVAKAVLELRQNLIAQYKSNPDMAWFRKRNVDLRYLYRDASGEVIATIDISPLDL